MTQSSNHLVADLLQLLDLLDLEARLAREVEAEAVGRDQGAALLGVADDLAQTEVEDVGARVVVHDVGAPLHVHVQEDGVADLHRGGVRGAGECADVEDVAAAHLHIRHDELELVLALRLWTLRLADEALVKGLASLLGVKVG